MTVVSTPESHLSYYQTDAAGKALGYEAVKYAQRTSTRSGLPKLITCLTVCTESPREIVMTLAALVHNMELFQSAVQLTLVIIFDGVKKMHSATRSLMSELLSVDFTANVGTTVIRTSTAVNVDVFMKHYDSVHISTEHIDVNTPEFASALASVHLISVVKHFNRGKADSHGWYFELVRHMDPEYVFLTDAGTMYHRDCLYALIAALQSDDKLVGVTGRQRCMVPGQMDMSWTEFILSPGPNQIFEYEFATSICMAAFSLLGFVPVLPGPCQMLSWSRIAQIAGYEPIRKYLEACRTVDDLDDPQFVTRCLMKLAEDRLLVALVASHTQLKTVWVSGATFLYRPETSWRRFLEQRRRWTNGTTFAFQFLLTDAGEQEMLNAASFVNPVNQVVLRFMWVVQVYQVYTNLLSPAVYANAFRLSILPTLRGIDFLNPIADLDVSSGVPEIDNFFYKDMSDILGYAVLLCFLLWTLVVRSLWGTASDPDGVSRKLDGFISFFSWLYVIITAGIVINVLYWICGSFVDQSAVFGDARAPLILLFVFGLQFLVVLLFDVNSFLRSIAVIPFYVVFQCFFNSLVLAYALARMFSVSWGTNVLEAKEAPTFQAAEEAVQRADGDSSSAPEDLKERRRERMIHASRVFFAVYVVANIVCTIALRFFFEHADGVAIYFVGAVLFPPSLFNTILSLFYFVQTTLKQPDQFVPSKVASEEAKVGANCYATVFAVPLADAAKRTDPNGLIPAPISASIAFLEKAVVKGVGLYGVTGEDDAVSHYIDLWNRGDSVEFQADERPEVVASVLRSYVKLLPETIFTIDGAANFAALRKMPTREQLRTVRALMTARPKPYFASSKLLFGHLAHVAGNGIAAKSSAAFLAKQFFSSELQGPAEFIILNYNFVFNHEHADEIDMDDGASEAVSRRTAFNVTDIRQHAVNIRKVQIQNNDAFERANRDRPAIRGSVGELKAPGSRHDRPSKSTGRGHHKRPSQRPPLEVAAPYRLEQSPPVTAPYRPEQYGIALQDVGRQPAQQPRSVIPRRHERDQTQSYETFIYETAKRRIDPPDTERHVVPGRPRKQAK